MVRCTISMRYQIISENNDMNRVDPCIELNIVAIMHAKKRLKMIAIYL